MVAAGPFFLSLYIMHVCFFLAYTTQIKKTYTIYVHAVLSQDEVFHSHKML